MTRRERTRDAGSLLPGVPPVEVFRQGTADGRDPYEEEQRQGPHRRVGEPRAGEAGAELRREDGRGLRSRLRDRGRRGRGRRRREGAEAGSAGERSAARAREGRALTRTGGRRWRRG